MNRISAADSLSIEMQSNRWRLIANGIHQERIVFEAQTGAPLRYVSGFGKTRRLPEGGMLPTEQIQRVVVGWSNQDESWHLGLVLASEIAQARGSRWCEIARWPDPDTNLYNDLAAQAGEMLASTLSRPFYLVPPRLDEQPAPPPAPARPLPDLPLTFDIWTFERSGQGVLQFVRARSWARAALRRIIWYSFWTIVYFVLVYATFTSGIAWPKPEFLPYLGMLSAAILIILIIKNVYLLITEPNRFVIDPDQRMFKAMRAGRERWHAQAAEISAVYISHVVGKIKKDRRTYHYGEFNLQLADGRFRHVLSIDHLKTLDVDPNRATEMTNEDTVTPLTTDNAITELQAAGLYAA